MTAIWLSAAHEVLETDLPEPVRAEVVERVILSLRSSNAAILDVVKGLGTVLTSNADTKRARGIDLLAEVVAAIPLAARSEDDVHHLAEFFVSRLTDWPAIHGALHGCVALLRRGGRLGEPNAATAAEASAPRVSSEDAVAMLRACAANVYVRSLAQADRGLALELLHLAAQRYGQAILDGGVDLLDWAIASVDGEKDPRCLLAAFSALRQLLALYHRQPQQSLHRGRLEDSADELFDVLACYFPISFTPPPDSPHRISRQQLAGELEAVLTASPLFGPHLLPLLLEKLSSSLRQAKLDALSALAACAERFPDDVLESHLSAVWAALRGELLAPAAGALLEPELRGAEEGAVAAATCLTRCVAAAQAVESAGGCEPALAEAVLADASMDDLVACVRSPGIGNDAAFRRSVLHVSALARVLGALVSAGGAAASKAAARLPRILAAAADAGDSVASICLAWSTVVTLLRAAATASLDATLVQRLVEQAAEGARNANQTATANGGEQKGPEGGDEGHEQEAASLWSSAPEAHTPSRAAWLQLVAIEAALRAPHLAAALPPTAVDSALAAALVHVTAPVDNSHVKLCGQASAVLCALAASSHSPSVAQRAVPSLLVAVQQQAGGGALEALQALAAVDTELLGEVMVALDGAIQTSLSTILSSHQADGAALATRLLQAASTILLAAESTEFAKRQQHATQVAQHLLDAVALQPHSTQVAAPLDAELIEAAARTAFVAARGAPADAQGRLAAAAASQQLPAEAGGLHLAVCSALIAPADPAALAAALPAPDAMRVTRQLITAAIASSTAPAAAAVATLAAAAVLNKAAGDPAQLAECLQVVVDQLLLPLALAQGGNSMASSSSGSSQQASVSAAWHTLAAVAQALLMRGQPTGDAIVSSVLGHIEVLAGQHTSDSALCAATASNGIELHEQHVAAVHAAADFLRNVLAVDGDPAALALNKHAHAITRSLWQQRLYTKASSELLDALQAGLSGSAGDAVAASAAAEQQHEQRIRLAHPALLLSLCQLLRGAPANVVACDMPRMLPWVIQALSAMQQEQWADARLLNYLLTLLDNFFHSEQGREVATRELSQLVPLLLGLALWRPATTVREAALLCLERLATLSYPSLHPYRRLVEKTAAAASDDPKRRVRLQAARVRQAWGA